MIQTLVIGGKSLLDFGVYYDGANWWRIPEKRVQEVTIPGRSGNLIIEEGAFENITIPFNCYIRSHFQRNFSALVNYLMTLTGYQRIESTEEPNVYRMGLISARIEPDTGQLNRSGQFTISINFKPQKWLKSGETGITVASGAVLINPTGHKALPLIRVTGTGTISIGSVTATLSANTGICFLDSEISDAYQTDGTNRNKDLTLSGSEFPSLGAGENRIAVTGFDTCEIIPRWWRL
jgi:phage-related protein